jgi:hypothetical protein
MSRPTLTPARWVNIDDIRPSTYNPRQADPARLDLVELSLRKLGFVLPLFADADGELLSGHQRHHVATRMGATRVPVAFTKAMDLNKRKAVNILFNRATNDFATTDSSKSITQRLMGLDLPSLAAKVPDKSLTSDDFGRTLNPQWIPIKPLLAANAGRWVDYAATMSRQLAGEGITMPIVVSPAGRVLNGLGRLQHMAEERHEEVPVVIVSEEEAELSAALLNLLSMDFNLHHRYADLLRYNSFRRSRGKRSCLGRGFIDYVWKGKLTGSQIDLAGNPNHKDAWIKEHGTSVVEFGGGHCTDGETLRQAGIHCSSFEPYRLTKNDTIDRDLSIRQTRAFLSDIASGRRFSSVFCPAVLNSVPFKEDRLHVLQLCAALCDETSHFYCSAVNTRDSWILHDKGKANLDRIRTNGTSFLLDYEPNTRISDLASLPKMQHYFTPPEMAELALTFWASCKSYDLSNNTYCRAWHRRPIDPARLRAAILFEFDLPYPDGQRMGLVPEALEAFGKRVGINLETTCIPSHA